jgi:hypothetical protein
MSSFYRQQLEAWLRTRIVKADTVFDIGGAQGEVKSRVAHWEVKEYLILDLPSFNLELPMTEELTKDLKKADIIFCLEVFEYLINPFQAFQNISNLLKSGGKAYITFAFVYPTHNEIELDSLRYTERGIVRLAEIFGLAVTSTWYRVDQSGLLKSFYSADGMHPAKGYNHHDATGFIVELTK